MNRPQLLQALQRLPDTSLDDLGVLFTNAAKSSDDKHWQSMLLDTAVEIIAPDSSLIPSDMLQVLREGVDDEHEST